MMNAEGGRMRRLHSAKGTDLCERTFRFGVRIVVLVRRLPKDVAGYEIGRQVLRSATSVGANVEEADAAESALDMVHKLKISLKEAQESRFWLRTIRDSSLLVEKELDALIQESDELVRIINTIVALTVKRISESDA
jgi:four helix bundle protein